MSCDDGPQLTFSKHTARLGALAMGGTLADMCEPLPDGNCNGESLSLGGAVGDFDGDGLADLFLTNTFGNSRLLRSLGGGEFEQVLDSGLQLDKPSSGVGWLDADKDGDLDLLVLSWTGHRQRYYRNMGDGTFVEDALGVGLDMSVNVHQGSTSMAIGDYDLDGWPDVFVSGWHLTQAPDDIAVSRLFRNRGASAPGIFEEVSLVAGISQAGTPAPEGFPQGVFKTFSSAFVDLDQDDYPELIIVADFGSEHLFRNLGDGTFGETGVASGVGQTRNGMGLAVGDLDRDGDLDYMAGALSLLPQSCEHYAGKPEGNRLYLNQWAPGESAPSLQIVDHEARVSCGAWSWGTIFADIDNDGDLDIAQTNGWYGMDDSFSIYENDRDRMWLNPGDPLGGMQQCSSALGFDDDGQGRALFGLDADEDGDIDFVVTRAGATPLFYRNDGGNDEGDFLRVTLRGVESNTSGRGARISVRTSNQRHWQTREVGQMSHFMGHSELVAHFGLGDTDGTIEEVRVCWPVPRRMQRLTAVPANSVLSLSEDEADIVVDEPCALAVRNPDY